MSTEKIKNEAIHTYKEECEKITSDDILTKLITAAIIICKTAGNQDAWGEMTEEEKESVVMDVMRDLMSYSDSVNHAEYLAAGQAEENAKHLQAIAPEQWNELQPNEKAIASVWIG